MVLALGSVVAEAGLLIEAARGVVEKLGRDLLALRVLWIALHHAAARLREIDPDKKLWPYHIHHANEEWLVVLRGRPTLRTPEGERELVEGDVVCFVRGGAGAHQVRNGTEEPVRILMLSTRVAPEILEYPDSEKVLTKDAKDEDIFTTRYGEPVDYWEGES
jgi:uncharacterized cupin superfamily protein